VIQVFQCGQQVGEDGVPGGAWVGAVPRLDLVHLGSRWARRGRSVMLQSIEQVFEFQNRLWVKAERWILEDCESPGTRTCPRRSDVVDKGLSGQSLTASR
jgi:hypothetical protein